MSVVKTGIRCRRKHRRFVPPSEANARVQFGYPKPGGHPCEMKLKDLSAGGLCFTLAHDLPGLDVGVSIDQARLLVGDRCISGDLFVMHLTPDASAGSVCGALFFPDGDENILAVQTLIAQFEQADGQRRFFDFVEQD